MSERMIASYCTLHTLKKYLFDRLQDLYLAVLKTNILFPTKFLVSSLAATKQNYAKQSFFCFLFLMKVFQDQFQFQNSFQIGLLDITIRHICYIHTNKKHTNIPAGLIINAILCNVATNSVHIIFIFSRQSPPTGKIYCDKIALVNNGYQQPWHGHNLRH